MKIFTNRLETEFHLRLDAADPTAAGMPDGAEFNVVGLLQRPTSAAAAHQRGSHRPTHLSVPATHGRGLKHRDDARNARRVPTAPADRNGARLSHLSIGCTAPKAGETPALQGNHLLIQAPLPADRPPRALIPRWGRATAGTLECPDRLTNTPAIKTTKTNDRNKVEAASRRFAQSLRSGETPLPLLLASLLF